MANRLNNIAGLFKEGRTRTIILATMLILLMAIVIGIFSMRAKVKGLPASASISDAPGDIQSVPFEAPNAEYARLQAQQNTDQAKEAQNSGGSAIPTIFKSSKDAGPITAADGDTGPGFIGLSRQQEAGDTFAPKSLVIDGVDKDKAKNCPTLEMLTGVSALNTPVYDANGRLIGYAGPDGKVRDLNGNIVGALGPDGLVRDVNGKVIGQKNTAMTGTPIYDANGRLIGYAGADGKVKDFNGVIIGTVGTDGLVRDVNGKVIGQKSAAMTGTPVYDANGRLVGYTGPDGKVYDASGKLIGTLGSDGEVRDANGKIIGHLAKPVYDANGKLLGFAGIDGKVRDANGNVIGTVGADGIARDLSGNIIGKAGEISPGTAVYDANGNIVGHMGPDGKVRDANGNIIGTMGIDGQVKDINGNVIGSINKPQSAANNVQNENGKIAAVDQSNLTPDQIARQNLQEGYARNQQILQDQKSSQALQQKQQAMFAQAGQLLASWTPPVQQYVPGQSKDGATGGTDNVGDNGDNQQNTASGNKSGTSNSPVFIKAGTIYYAVINTSINSDEPGPIMATIINGQFKGGKLLGTLTNQGKAVMLSFNILTLQQFSKSIPINSVAIDQNTARTGLSTETDNHYLLRYGSLFASAFVQGYAQAITSSGTTKTENILGGTTTTTPPLSAKEKFSVALGNVGTQFSNQLGSTFSKPPTVYVAAGTAVGILFMGDVSLPAA